MTLVGDGGSLADNILVPTFLNPNSESISLPFFDAWKNCVLDSSVISKDIDVHIDISRYYYFRSSTTIPNRSEHHSILFDQFISGTSYASKSALTTPERFDFYLDSFEQLITSTAPVRLHNINFEISLDVERILYQQQYLKVMVYQTLEALNKYFVGYKFEVVRNKNLELEHLIFIWVNTGDDLDFEMSLESKFLRNWWFKQDRSLSKKILVMLK